ncbi:uncharacterized protein L201_000532 [Kwoniella dendrophila CBS 6074]|uniref:Aspartate aminotransferase n=1 Tax=Kwoniella dendrophila CBS 6074 TaxID=1295534 RepID=A0AAX4JJS6_9TREE
MSSSTANPFSSVPYTPPDAVFALKAAFDADTSPLKVNLGPGAYLDDNGKPWILNSVAAAEQLLIKNPPGHEYLPILGLPAFRDAARKVVFGSNSKLLNEKRVATIQAVSGTGAVHLALSFLKFYLPKSNKVFVSKPSWANHRVMAEFLNFDVIDYPYYDDQTRGVNFEGMKKSLNEAEEGSIWILHACAHNPTGCDLTKDQWKEIGSIVKERGLIPILDCAYQGFATGSLDNDAWSIRFIFEELQIPGIVCQSFSKSMGLYGERVGAIHVIVQSPESENVQDQIKSIESQIGWISRKEISVPPRYGATIASSIIQDSELYKTWQGDLDIMSNRITSMRSALLKGLTERKTPGTWNHITDQIGMFSYTGLTKSHVAKLREKHIYLLDNGRVSMSGLNTGNVDYFCKCVDEVVRSS